MWESDGREVQLMLLQEVEKIAQSEHFDLESLPIWQKVRTDKLLMHKALAHSSVG